MGRTAPRTVANMQEISPDVGKRVDYRMVSSDTLLSGETTSASLDGSDQKMSQSLVKLAGSCNEMPVNTW
jgi:hypothetical protein